MGATVKATEPLLSLTELAQQLRRPRGWVDRLVRRGEIPHVRLGRQYFFRPSEVETWIAAHTVTPARAAGKSRAVRDELKDFGLTAEDLDAVH